MEILEQLSGGDRRSIGQANQVVAKVLKTPRLLSEVVRGLTRVDPLIRMRCADVLEKVSVLHPEWLQPHKQAILSCALRVQEKEVRWHMAQMLPRLDLAPGEKRTAVALLFDYLDDSSQIVKTWTMQALFDVSNSDARLRRQVIPILKAAAATGGGATRSRSKKLLAQLI